MKKVGAQQNLRTATLQAELQKPDQFDKIRIMSSSHQRFPLFKASVVRLCALFTNKKSEISQESTTNQDRNFRVPSCNRLRFYIFYCPFL